MPEHLDDANLEVVVAVVAGLFSLLGAFAGAFLSRRTEYLKWLRQSRSETFAEFLRLLSVAQADVTAVLEITELDPLQRQVKATDAYNLIENYARVVRLYLPKCRREKFNALVREVRAYHVSASSSDSRLLEMEKKLDQIQQIFEEAIR